MEYCLVRDEDPLCVSEQVNALLADGWQCYGPTQVAMHVLNRGDGWPARYYIYAQTMLREKSPTLRGETMFTTPPQQR